MTARTQRPTPRIGARLLSAGTAFGPGGVAASARRLEAAGFDSLWVSDHLAMPERTRSAYPYTADGSIPWGEDLGWLEAMTALAVAAAVTERIELGTAVLVAALRHPLVVARQAAAICVEAGDRLVLGVGAGWLAEEFAAVGVPFEARGRRLDAWLRYVREAMTGHVGVRGPDDPYPNPVALRCLPVPAAGIGLLVGGTSDLALRRALTVGDGWLGILPVEDLVPERVVGPLRRLHEEADRLGRPLDDFRVCLQVTGSGEAAATIGAALGWLGDLGVHDVLVDADDGSSEGARSYLTRLQEAASHPIRGGAA